MIVSWENQTCLCMNPTVGMEQSTKTGKNVIAMALTAITNVIALMIVNWD